MKKKPMQNKSVKGKPIKKVFVSGCYDILHAGHVQFFQDARALGDHLTVCFASDEVLMLSKKRPPSIPQDNKQIILSSLRCIDHVVTSSNLDPVFDFVDHIERIRPNLLVVTEDDRNVEVKKVFCKKYGIELVVLPKRNIVKRVSTTSILASIKNIHKMPLRVDFAGGWLDVPKLSRDGGYIVNCSIQPLVSLDNWPYQKNSGLGGSAAFVLLQAKMGVKSEIDMGVGWQDPVIISHTGMCVWRSGVKPVLDVQVNPDWLNGKMLIYWTDKQHIAAEHLSNERDYDLIFKAGILARDAVNNRDIPKLAKAVAISYKMQLKEGMEPLPKIKGALSSKYLGAGHGGYALYIFKNEKDRDAAHKKNKQTMKIEPYIKDF